MRPRQDSATRGARPCRSVSCQIHRLVVDELLDAMEDRFALLAVQLAGLLGEEPVDVRIASVGVAPARDGERLEAWPPGS